MKNIGRRKLGLPLEEPRESFRVSPFPIDLQGCVHDELGKGPVCLVDGIKYSVELVGNGEIPARLRLCGRGGGKRLRWSGVGYLRLIAMGVTDVEIVRCFL
jgi:hypothetical protein